VHRQARAGKLSDEVDAHPCIFILSPGGCRPQRLGPEDDAVVVDWDRQDLLEDCRELVGRVLAEAEEIEIAGGAVGCSGPQAEQHRALEDKPLTVRRDAQAIEQPFDDIAGHQQLRVLSALAGSRGQAVAHRDPDIPGRPAHVMASR
jgi:hypothetical protein